MKSKIFYAAAPAVFALIMGAIFLSKESTVEQSELRSRTKEVEVLKTGKSASVAATANVYAPPTRTETNHTSKIDASKLLQPEDLGVTIKVSLREVFPDLNLPVGDWKSVMPDSITICPVPGMALTFYAASKETGTQRNTWVGTNSVQGASLTFCATNGLWDGVITLPGANQYMIHATNNGATVVESFDDKQSCGVSGNVRWRQEADIGTRGASTTVADGNYPIVAPDAAFYTVDILVVYTTGSKPIWGNTPDEVVNRYASYLASANTYFTNSLVTNLRFNVVGAFEAIGYISTNTFIGYDLDAITPFLSGASALAVKIAQVRDVFHADLVQFIVDGPKTGGATGIAIRPGAHSAVMANVDAFTVTHELCHNFGCTHDRVTVAKETGVPSDGDGNYNYGYNYIDLNPLPNPDGSIPINRDNGTVMAYSTYRIPYFSNPNISYRGVALGVAADQPKAAYNARTLMENAAQVAGLKAGTNDPVITTQPVNITVETGTTLTLSVVATGSNLTYQWYRVGSTTNTAISGATSATYSKVNTANADAAFYYVLVATATGATQSNTVSVSTTTAPTQSTPSAPSSGGGGGGGGAPGPIYWIGLFAAAALRKITKGK
jgi:hypothetical protein